MFGPIKRKLREKENPEVKQREQEETARVYAEFVKSFQVDSEDSAASSRRFIRGGIINPNATLEEQPSAVLPVIQSVKSEVVKKGLWVPSATESLQNRANISINNEKSEKKPTTTLNTELGEGIGNFSALTASSSSSSGLKSASGLASITSQKTREIDSFLEEIKRKQELLDQRKQLRQLANSTEEPERDLAKKKLQFLEEQTKGRGSIPGVVEAEETSNLYLGNLSPEITEEFLCQQFGKYGTIASVKIMYPRSEEERTRRRHCGFVSFTSRSMAEVAKDSLDGQEFFGMPIRIGWGKAVAKLPAASTPLTVGVKSLMAFDPAKTRDVIASNFSDAPTDITDATKLATIQVQVPKDLRQKAVIDIVAQYVVEDGYPLEQLIIEKEGKNEYFQFLLETSSPNAFYYKWRLYSLAQGDTLRAWRTEPYCMFYGSQQWVPPGREYFEDIKRSERQSNFSDAIPSQASKKTISSQRGHKNEAARGGRSLDEASREELENLLRTLTRDRSSILMAMAFCLDHADCALEISECLMESLTIQSTPVDTKISRLYLVSDVLHNTSSARQPAWAYHGAMERYLPEIFNHHNKVLQKLSGRLTLQVMKDRVLKVLRVWESWALYPPLFTKGLESSFLKDPKLIFDVVFKEAQSPLSESDEAFDPELDGESLCDKSTLSRYPHWIRQSLKEWNSLDLTCLESLCNRRGLSISPELPDDSTSQEKISSEQHPQTYAGMRQLLIRRLVECEAYWKNKQHR